MFVFYLVVIAVSELNQHCFQTGPEPSTRIENIADTRISGSRYRCIWDNTTGNPHVIRDRSLYTFFFFEVCLEFLYLKFFVLFFNNSLLKPFSIL